MPRFDMSGCANGPPPFAALRTSGRRTYKAALIEEGAEFEDASADGLDGDGEGEGGGFVDEENDAV